MFAFTTPATTALHNIFASHISPCVNTLIFSPVHPQFCPLSIVTLCHALSVANKYRGKAGKDWESIPLLQKLFVFVLNCVAGSTTISLFLNQTPPILLNNYHLPILLIIFFLFNGLNRHMDLYPKVFKPYTNIITPLLTITDALSTTGTLTKSSLDTALTTKALPFTGALIAGLIGGCASTFWNEMFNWYNRNWTFSTVSFGNKKGFAYTFQSVFLASIMYLITLGKLPFVIPGVVFPVLPINDAKALVACFLVVAFQARYWDIQSFSDILALIPRKPVSKSIARDEMNTPASLSPAKKRVAVRAKEPVVVEQEEEEVPKTRAMRRRRV